MSLIQGSTNPRFIIGEALSITKFPIPISYLCRNTSLSKTQGLPLVITSPKLRFALGIHTSIKPKILPWSAHIQQLRRPPSRVQVLSSKLPPHYLERLLIRSKPICTPHNHHESTFVGQEDPPPDCMTRPSI